MTGHEYTGYYGLVGQALRASRWIQFANVSEEPSKFVVTIEVRTWRLHRIPTPWLRRRVKRQVFEAARPDIPSHIALVVQT